MRDSPQFSVQYRARVRPRSPSRIGSSSRNEQRFENRPLGVGNVHVLDLRHWR